MKTEIRFQGWPNTSLNGVSFQATIREDTTLSNTMHEIVPSTIQIQLQPHRQLQTQLAPMSVQTMQIIVDASFLKTFLKRIRQQNRLDM